MNFQAEVNQSTLDLNTRIKKLTKRCNDMQTQLDDALGTEGINQLKELVDRAHETYGIPMDAVDRGEDEAAWFEVMRRKESQDEESPKKTKNYVLGDETEGVLAGPSRKECLEYITQLENDFWAKVNES